MLQNKTRRQFLQGCSLAIAALAGARLTHLSFDPSVSAAGLPAASNLQSASSPLVVVFLRGGWDGLSVVTPLADDDRKNYEQSRPDIKIREANLLALDDRFGMHPALAPLHEHYQDGKAAWIHAVGLDVDTRSHFDAQEFIELGTPGVKSTTSGWITRHLQNTTTEGLAGQIPVVANPNPSSALLNTNSTVSMNELGDLNQWDSGYREEQQAALRRLYAGETVLHQAGLRTLEVVRSLAPYIEQEYVPSAGVEYNDDEFSKRMKSIARLIKMDTGLQIATVDFGGWDTHEDQNDGADGYLSNLLASLGSGLASFYQDLNNGYTDNLSVVVISEFGRRLAQNDSRGTDHGHGSLMLALGAGVNGGQVYGKWPGLANEQLYDRADLAVTTDFRQVLGELLVKRHNNTSIEQVFPGFQMAEDSGLFRT